MKRFSNILFVNEPDVDNANAFSEAVELAKSHQASLMLVDIVEPISPVQQVISTVMAPGKLSELMSADKKNGLDELLSTLQGKEIKTHTKILFGKPFVEIIKEVLRSNVDLVVKAAAKKQGFSGLFLGGTDLKLLRKCPCPVCLVKDSPIEAPETVLVGIDYEPDNPENNAMNQKLLESGVSIALAEFSELHVVHAWVFEHENFLRSANAGLTSEEVEDIIVAEENLRRRWLTKVVTEFFQSTGLESDDFLSPKIHLLRGDPTQVIPECAKRIGADMVVLGTVGRTGVSELMMGNTAEAILHQLDGSFLAVKPDNFITSVTID